MAAALTPNRANFVPYTTTPPKEVKSEWDEFPLAKPDTPKPDAKTANGTDATARFPAEAGAASWAPTTSW